MPGDAQAGAILPFAARFNVRFKPALLKGGSIGLPSGFMSDSQKFPVAAHTLAYLAHVGAHSPETAASSSVIAASVPTNPVVVRRVTAMLAKAGLIGCRSGARGGAWLNQPAEEIPLDRVLRAVNGCAQLGCPPKGAEGCPVGARIPSAVGQAIASAEEAAAERLSQITVADLLRG